MLQVCEVSAEGQVRYELETRFQQLQSRLSSVTLETEEVKSYDMPLIFEHITFSLCISVKHIQTSLSDLWMTLVLHLTCELQISKTLKATHSNLLENICDDDCNPTPDTSTTQSAESAGDGTGVKPSLAKRRANLQDTETFYFTVRSKPAHIHSQQSSSAWRKVTVNYLTCCFFRK